MAGRHATVLLAVALLLAGATPAGVVGAQSAGEDTVTVGDVQIDPDDVVLGVNLREDGNATWRVSYRMRLTTENETAAFEELAADVREQPGEYTAGFGRQMRATARTAANETGREMRIANVTVDAETRQLPQSYGVITYRFTWTNFAAVDGPRLRAGDALAQLFLDAETTLLVEWPARYQVTTVDPQPTDRREHAVVWDGPLEFTAGQPTLAVTSAATSSEESTSASPTASPSTGASPALVAGGVLALLACVGGALYAVRRTDAFGSSSADSLDEPAETESAGAAGTARASDSKEASEPPEELLSNAERVLRLLEAHGGRMKQQQVVQELEWTDAKTSQVVSDLREADEIETFRIGRENVVRRLDGDSDGSGDGDGDA